MGGNTQRLADVSRVLRDTRIESLPLLLLDVDARLGHLTANPLQEVTFRTGKFALIFLVASLSITPSAM